MGKFSAFLPLRGRIAEDSDPYTLNMEWRDKLEFVGDGFPVPKPGGYGFAGTNAKFLPGTAGTGNPSPTIWCVISDDPSISTMYVISSEMKWSREIYAL